MTDIDKTIEETKTATLPYESWERLGGESGMAYSAFRAYRDYGPDRNIRKAVEGQFHKAELPEEFPPPAETPRANLEAAIARKYRMWRGWAAQFRWRERAADYDRYLDRLKQTELRKTIEEQGKVHRLVTGKMLLVVTKKLEMMNPADLTQDAVTEWVETAIRTDREGAGLIAPNGKSEPKQGEINFTPEFEGL
jgi:hypothetical protein